MPTDKRRAALLINLGTPMAPDEAQVREYLREFLMDPYVVDIPYPLRLLFVHGVVLPRRPKASAEAYRKVWTERGSPLLVHHLDLREKVQRNLGEDWIVSAAMRYGQPSIESAVRVLREAGAREITVFPLYPQYSLSATESSIVRARNLIAREIPGSSVREIPAFYREPAFARAFAEVAREATAGYSYDHMLFSFHGLPERQITKTDRSGIHCLRSEGCCELSEKNPDCYRSQCYFTAEALATELGLEKGRYSVAFQSRMGRTPWIRPFTDEFLRAMPARGIRRLAVMCPAFVADCLETLEEIAIRGREDFIRAGGEELRLVPSLNASEVWAKAVAGMIRSFGGR